jgi:outer membrane protein assembly factor BamB
MTAQIYDDTTLARLAIDWMTHDVAGTTDTAHLEQILAATGRKRPQSRWVALLKEPPMRIQSLVAVGTPARRPLLLLAALALLILGVIAAAVIGTNLLKPPAALDEWPMYHGDATRSGIAVSGPVGNPSAAWTYHAAGQVNKGVSVVGDAAFFTSSDGIAHALALADGKEVWAFDMGVEGGGAGVVVAAGIVYAVDHNGIVHALDAGTGSARWTSIRQAASPTQPVVAGGRIYMGDLGGELVAINVADGSEAWRISTGGAAGNPAYDGSSVFVTSQTGGLNAYDPTSGALKWHTDLGGDQVGTPSVAAGLVFVGPAGDAPSGRLRAVDAATGLIRWTVNEPLLGPAIVDGVVYTTSSAGDVAALDPATGNQRWRVKLNGIVRGVAVAGGIVYAPADAEQRVYALDAATGGELWHFDVDSSNQCCIAVARGSAFVGTVAGTVYRIVGDGTKLTPHPIAAAPSAAPTPAATEPAASSGPAPAQFLRKTTGPQEGFIPPAGMAYDGDGRIWAVDPVASRFAIFDSNGTFLEYWGQRGTGDGQFILGRENGDGYGDIAFAPDGSFYVLDVGNRRVDRFDADRRFVLSWGGFGNEPGKFNDPVGIEVDGAGSVHVVDDIRGVLEKYGAKGNVVRTVDVFSNTHSGINAANCFTIDKDGNAYIGQLNPNQVAKFDPTGKLLQVFGADGPGSMPVEGPVQVLVDDSTGRLFVTIGPQRGSLPGVLVFEPDGTYVAGFGPRGDQPGQLEFPTGILLDGKGGLFVEDASGAVSGNFRVGSLQLWKLLPPLAP